MRKRVIYASPVDFYKRLKEACKDKGITFNQLERDGVCSAKTIIYYSTHNGMPTAQVLQRLCSYLGVSCDYLLGLSNVRDIPPQWIFYEGECICSNCGNRGETTFLYCPSCGKAMSVKEIKL